MKRALLCLAVAWMCTGCVETTLSQRLRQKPAIIRTARATSFWEVRTTEGTAGWVVFFGSPETPDESFYSVRNAWHQELGIVDSLGIAWRYRPHDAEAEHVATGTLRDGVVAILHTSGTTQLIERPISELASAYETSLRESARAREAASSN